MKCLSYIIRHKWYVIVANYKYGLGLSFWRVLKHDVSKFTFIEYGPYRNKYFKGYSDPRYIESWLHHKNHNEHHPAYWCDLNVKDGELNVELHDMSYTAIREMICDWIAMCREFTKSWPTESKWDWYYKLDGGFEKNTRAMMSEKSIERLEGILVSIGLTGKEKQLKKL